MLKGLVLKKQADLFTVELENKEIVQSVARNLKRDGVFVGDKVQLDEDRAICKVETRKNVLIRPPVANIDRMFIVIAPVPKADFLLVDKLIIFCTINNIEPIFCINKCDLDAEFCEETEKVYKKIVKTLVFSSLDESVENLKKETKGVCVLAGQSAVGKSSIINALKKTCVAKVDTFSKKIQRGKQTTRTVELYKFGKGKYLADTAGFSKLDERLLEIDERELKNYYTDFLPYMTECKYSTCVHMGGEVCGVLKAVESGKISKLRYSTYCKLYQNLKNIKRY